MGTAPSDALRRGRVVVVGAGLAGLRAAQALRAAGFGGRLTIVEPAAEVPCDRPPLSKEILTGRWSPDDARLASAEDLERLDIRLRLGEAAVGLDLERRAVRLASGPPLRYDGLILATGAAPRRLPALDGVPGVLVLRDLADALTLRARLLESRRVAVIGAGVLGVEIAASAVELGVEVELLEVAPVPLERAVGPVLGRRWLAWLADAGVAVRCGTTVERADPVDGGVRLGLAGGETLAVDVAVVAVGAAPEVGWLAGCGLRIEDGVVCDELCAAAPGVYAAGDVARWDASGDGRHVRLEHWTNAAEQGAAAAQNLLWELLGLPEERRPYRPVPYVWSDHLSQRLQVVGERGAADEVTVLCDGGAGGAGLLAIYARDGLLAAAVGVGQARAVARCRMLLAEGASAAEAVAALAEPPVPLRGT